MKSIFIKILSVCLALTYFYIIAVNNILNLQTKTFWFWLALFFCGIPLLLKAVFFMADASLLSGSILCLTGICGVVTNLLTLSVFQTLPWLALCFATAHLIVFFVFRQNIHVKIFAIIACLVLILFMKEIFGIGLVAFWCLICFYLVIILTLSVISIYKNTRRVK
ncbi:MAG: hypothetical protein RR140_03875 [Clostridia bacterium]